MFLSIQQNIIMNLRAKVNKTDNDKLIAAYKRRCAFYTQKSHLTGDEHRRVWTRSVGRMKIPSYYLVQAFNGIFFRFFGNSPSSFFLQNVDSEIDLGLLIVADKCNKETKVYKRLIAKAEKEGFPVITESEIIKDIKECLPAVAEEFKLIRAEELKEKYYKDIDNIPYYIDSKVKEVENYFTRYGIE